RSGRGNACSLYTDLANPTSNAIYRRLGYPRVCDVMGRSHRRRRILMVVTPPKEASKKLSDAGNDLGAGIGNPLRDLLPAVAAGAWRRAGQEVFGFAPARLG